MVLGSGATVLVDIAPDGRTTVRWQSYFRDRKFEASPFDDFLSGEANGISLGYAARYHRHRGPLLRRPMES